MLTSEQCIEVAEKVWGLERHYHQAIDKHYITIDSRIFYDEQLAKEVNSWQGFGRTVEAMLAKGIPPQWSPNKDYKANDHSLDAVKRMASKIIERTHLAALEALK